MGATGNGPAGLGGAGLGAASVTSHLGGRIPRASGLPELPGAHCFTSLSLSFLICKWWRCQFESEAVGEYEAVSVGRCMSQILRSG